MNNDKIYDVSVLNECFRHLNQNGTEQELYFQQKDNTKIESLNPVVGFALSKRKLRDYNEGSGDNITIKCNHPNPERSRRKGTDLYNDLCKIFGHDTVDIQYLKEANHQDDIEEKTGLNAVGGLWPHERNCNLWSAENPVGKFNSIVSKVSTSSSPDNKYIREIKCL